MSQLQNLTNVIEWGNDERNIHDKVAASNTANKIANKINDKMINKFPYFVCNAGKILGEVVSITLSLDDPSTWPNKILMNSRYQKITIHCHALPIEFDYLSGKHNARLRRKKVNKWSEWEKIADHAITQLERILTDG